jgi:hypothetical protein
MGWNSLIGYLHFYFFTNEGIPWPKTLFQEEYRPLAQQKIAYLSQMVLRRVVEWFPLYL